MPTYFQPSLVSAKASDSCLHLHLQGNVKYMLAIHEQVALALILRMNVQVKFILMQMVLCQDPI